MPDYKMTKSVGEHWTCAQLARWGWAPALTRDGIERTDVLAVATHLGERPTIEVQVKTANQTASGRTSWPLGEKAQSDARSNREWFVLVLVPRTRSEPIRGFVVPRDHLTAATWVVHQNWLTDPSAQAGRRNAPVSQARVNTAVWERYEGRWDLLDMPTNQVPVLLPDWVRQRAGEPRVGLPPAHPWNSRMPTDWH